MFEWSDTDLIMQQTVRGFIDKEIRPHLDALETGEISPYPIARKLFSEFGLDVLATEGVKTMLDKEREKQNTHRQGPARLMALSATANGLRRRSFAALDGLIYLPVARASFNLMLNGLLARQSALARLRPVADYAIARSSPPVPGTGCNPVRPASRASGFGHPALTAVSGSCWSFTEADT